MEAEISLLINNEAKSSSVLLDSPSSPPWLGVAVPDAAADSAPSGFVCPTNPSPQEI